MKSRVSPVVGIIIVLVVAAVAVYLIVRFTGPPKPVVRPTAPGTETRERGPGEERPAGERREGRRGARRGERRGEQPGSEGE